MLHNLLRVTWPPKGPVSLLGVGCEVTSTAATGLEPKGEFFVMKDAKGLAAGQFKAAHVAQSNPVKPLAVQAGDIIAYGSIRFVFECDTPTFKVNPDCSTCECTFDLLKYFHVCCRLFVFVNNTPAAEAVNNYFNLIYGKFFMASTSLLITCARVAITVPISFVDKPGPGVVGAAPAGGQACTNVNGFWQIYKFTWQIYKFTWQIC